MLNECLKSMVKKMEKEQHVPVFLVQGSDFTST